MSSSYHSHGGAPEAATVARYAIIGFGGVIVLLIIFYVIYHLYALIMSTSLKTTTILRHPKRVPITSGMSISEGSKLPKPINGKEYSYSFWLYIDKFNPNSSTSKHVLSRGSTFRTYMSTSKNELMIEIAHETSALDTASSTSKVVAKVEYIPIQRWVNIVIVVDNQFITVFIDGEIHTVINVESSVVATSEGEFFIGAKESMIGIDGIISNVKYFNYSITVNDSRLLYNAGPSSKTILQMLGLPMYGVRSPFYRVDNIQEVESSTT
jgi:hypothetical protein